ncbi:MAG: Serine phosphatase RsbU, regulator of sigma subunit [uncultured Quadrisphaera sp.]|uniref:protein-serine/threonine phosphatase n=1 Tax=uncultured Quadrisphaera sp. TaxID=904978 RepID=A0A6J4P0Z2_9ACTN|nr:MAG: Serine phosphatase RsbU, regulator of sigma subunit [uncultured Quadrisphaera sp.]
MTAEMVRGGLAAATAGVLAPGEVGEDPAAVLLVDLATRRVVHANDLARQLAPALALPALVDHWSDAAGLRDLDGEELSETAHPLSLAAQGLPVPGQAVTARRASDVSARREPLFAIGLPLSEAPGLGEHALVVLIPLHDESAAGGATALARSQARVREQAVLATGTSFTVADARAEDSPLVWVNPAFTAVTGYSAAESVGRNCRFLQGPDTDPAAVGLLREAIAAGREVAVTLLNHRKDGTAFWNHVALSPVRDGRGEVTHVVGVQSDVTARVEADRARQAALLAEGVARAGAERAGRAAEASRREAEQAGAAAAAALREAQLARADAERANARLTLLAEGSHVLAATLDTDEALDRLLGLIVPTVADWAVVNLADERGRLGRPAVVRHRDGHEALLRRYAELVPATLAPGTPLHDLLQGGPPRAWPDFSPPPVEGLTEGQREVRSISMALGATSLLFVPLATEREVLGTMMLVQGSSGRGFDDDDLEVAADLGRRAGLVLDNARLYGRQQRTALALQRSLLPRLPTLPGVRLAARYHPAGHDRQVGGDWWDVFALPDGAIALAIGDVMGHDIAAAAAMGQLRSVLRTCAWNGDEPATVLERMDQLVQGFEMAQLATCVYARLSTGAGRGAQLRWASAGHLPLALLPADGPARLLSAPAGVPLGVPVGERRTHTEVDLAPGDTLLLFTDGLVETRGGDIEDDLARLLRDLAGHRPGTPPEVLVDRLVSERSDRTDDVALLAVQVL